MSREHFKSSLIGIPINFGPFQSGVEHREGSGWTVPSFRTGIA